MDDRIQTPPIGIFEYENEEDAELCEFDTDDQSKDDTENSPHAPRSNTELNCGTLHPGTQHAVHSRVDESVAPSNVSNAHVALNRTGNAQSDSNCARCDDDIPLSTLLAQIQNLRAANRQAEHTRSFLPGVDLTFEPLLSDPTRSRETGVANSYTLRNAKGPQQVFQRFIPRETLAKMAQNTNKYAMIHNAGTGRTWENTNRSEMTVFTSLIHYLGVYDCPRVEDY